MTIGAEAYLELPADGAEQSAEEEWTTFGEVLNVEPAPFRDAVLEHFEQSAANLAGNGIKTDHEVVTSVDNELIPVIKSHRKGHTKEVEIAAGTLVAGLAVYGILKATARLHLKHKR